METNTDQLIAWTVDVNFWLDFSGAPEGEQLLSYMYQAGLRGIYMCSVQRARTSLERPIFRLRGPSKQAILVFLLEVHGMDESDLPMHMPTPILGLGVTEEEGCPCCD